MKVNSNIKVNSNKLLFFFKKICFLLIIALTFLFYNVPAALAHRPHDVIEQIALSPTYEQDQTLFIIVRGNLFKSTDGGSSWKRTVRGLDNKNKLSSLAISPQTKGTIFLSSTGDGIYKSKDEGLSWFKVNNGLRDLKIELLSISSNSSEVVLAAGSEKGLYKTKNEGGNWTQVINSSSKITAIAFSPGNKDQAIVGDNQGILYVSTDGGDTWKEGFQIKNKGAITAVVISPNFSSDSTFFVGTEKGSVFKTVDQGLSFSEVSKGISGGAIRDISLSPNYAKDSTLFTSTWDEAVFQSNDAGKNWTKFSQGILKDRQADEDQFGAPHFSNLRISNAFSQDKTIFLGGFNGLFKSTDGGYAWRELETLSRGTVIGLAVSPDYKNDSTVAIATYVGNLYRSNDKGVTWTPINKGLEVPRFTNNFKHPHQDPRRFFDIAFSPNYRSDGTLFSSVLWNDFLKSTDRGKHWNIIRLPDQVRGISIAVSPGFADDNTVYVGTQKGNIYKSTDGGRHFSLIKKLGGRSNNEPPSLVISPDFSSDKTLYASGTEGVYKTADGGNTWQPVTKGIGLAKSSIIQLVISPNYKVDKTVLLGAETGLFRTKDGGNSWVKLAGATYGKDAHIEGIAISPDYQNDQTFIVSARGRGLFKTLNGGETFTHIGDDSISLSKLIGPPSAPMPIIFSPSYAIDKTIYGFGSATTEVFKSTDGGDTWATITVPRHDIHQYDFLTWVDLGFDVYRKHILKVIAALIVALSTYLLLGYLNLEKKLPFSRVQIKAGGTFAVFVVALIVLFV